MADELFFAKAQMDGEMRRKNEWLVVKGEWIIMGNALNEITELWDNLTLGVDGNDDLFYTMMDRLRDGKWRAL